MRPAFIGSRISIDLRGTAIPGAEDRQRRIPGFDQSTFSKISVVCIGAGGIISQIAPTLVRKGIGRITLLDHDRVEPTNLNRQRFYIEDVGENKALALAKNLRPECIAATQIRGYVFRLEEAIARAIDLDCDIAICGVDNNPARVAASLLFRSKHIPVIFTAVSRDADHGYVFVQGKRVSGVLRSDDVFLIEMPETQSIRRRVLRVILPDKEGNLDRASLSEVFAAQFQDLPD